MFFIATGLSPWTCQWWGAYSAHVTRRNNIIHRGAHTTADDARASIESMWDFINFVRQEPEI